MTEYDYSPDAYERHLVNQQRIANWIDNTEAHAHEFRSPFGAEDRSRAAVEHQSPPPPPHHQHHPHHTSYSRPPALRRSSSDGAFFPTSYPKAAYGQPVGVPQSHNSPMPPPPPPPPGLQRRHSHHANDPPPPLYQAQLAAPNPSILSKEIYMKSPHSHRSSRHSSKSRRSKSRGQVYILQSPTGISPTGQPIYHVPGSGYTSPLQHSVSPGHMSPYRVASPPLQSASHSHGSPSQSGSQLYQTYTSPYTSPTQATPPYGGFSGYPYPVQQQQQQMPQQYIMLPRGYRVYVR